MSRLKYIVFKPYNRTIEQAVVFPDTISHITIVRGLKEENAEIVSGGFCTIFKRPAILLQVDMEIFPKCEGQYTSVRFAEGTADETCLQSRGDEDAFVITSTFTCSTLADSFM